MLRAPTVGAVLLNLVRSLFRSKAAALWGRAGRGLSPPLRLVHLSVHCDKTQSPCNTAAQKEVTHLLFALCGICWDRATANPPGTGAGRSSLRAHVGCCPSIRGVRARSCRSGGVHPDHPKTDVYTKRKGSDIYQALTGIVDWESVDGDLFFLAVFVLQGC